MTPMGNLRQQAEADLAFTLEGDFSLPVELTDPDGLKQSVTGQVLYDTVVVSPDTGQEVVVNNPVITLRRSSLNRIPGPAENWFVKIPTTPSATAEMSDFVIDTDRPPEGGGSIGFIRLYLKKASQINDAV
jgi:hypothetical protein